MSLHKVTYFFLAHKMAETGLRRIMLQAKVASRRYFKTIAAVTEHPRQPRSINKTIVTIWHRKMEELLKSKGR